MLYNRILSVFFLGLLTVQGLRSDPDQDTSDECNQCKLTVQALDIKWTNETTVEGILEDLEAKCDTLSSAKDRKLCKQVAEIFVQIPPAIFEGMEDLAWPIDLGMCATLRHCEVKCCAEDSPPEQVHLSLASHDRSLMGVTWVSLNQQASVVEYGLSPDDLSFRETGTLSTSYDTGIIFGVAPPWTGTVHRATMVNLEPSTTYYYRVGDGDVKWSQVFEFRTLTPGRDVVYGVIADMDFGEASDATVNSLLRLVADKRIDVMIHSGDISYADGYEPHWDDFFNKIEPIAATIPYMASPGNHEFWYNFSSFKSRFFLPGVVDNGGSGDNMYYSWNAEYAHFISGNSESPLDTAYFTESFLDFLEDDLSGVDRSQTPWVIAHFHRPMYCSNDNACDRGASTLRGSGEDIMHEGQVDLVISGHVHAYERTWPVYHEEATSTENYDSPKATTYIMQGASGNREGNKGNYPPQDQLPAWSAHVNNQVGYALMKISASAIDWTFYESSTGVDGGEDVILDHIVMTR